MKQRMKSKSMFNFSERSVLILLSWKRLSHRKEEIQCKEMYLWVYQWKGWKILVNSCLRKLKRIRISCSSRFYATRPQERWKHVYKSSRIISMKIAKKRRQGKQHWRAEESVLADDLIRQMALDSTLSNGAVSLEPSPTQHMRCKLYTGAGKTLGR